MTDEPEGVSGTPNKGGRPRKLIADERTLKEIEGLGRLHATVRECAAFFRVSHQTFQDFLNRPEVREVYESGQAGGKISLRRLQIRLAEKHPAMAIFLGKNLLGQSDRHEHTGRDGGAIEVEIRDVTDEELDARIRAALALPAPEPVDAEFE